MEAFVEWMMLEAKASREGMPVDPAVEDTALVVDKTFRNIAAELMRFANENPGEIEAFHRRG